MTQMPDRSPQRRARAPAAAAAAAPAPQAVTVVLSDEEVVAAARRVAGGRPQSASRSGRFQKLPKKRKLDERHDSAERATWDSPEPVPDAGQAQRSSQKRRSKERVASASSRRKTAQVAAKHKAKEATPKRKFVVRDDDNNASEASEVGGEDFSAAEVPSPRRSGSARKRPGAASARRISQEARNTAEAVEHVRHAREQAELKRRAGRGARRGARRGGKVRAKRVPFTEDEESAILEGVKKYKKSRRRWANILKGALRVSLHSAVARESQAGAPCGRTPACLPIRMHVRISRSRSRGPIRRRCCTDYPFHKKRDSVAIKDKWRNMLSKNPKLKGHEEPTP
jgi:hypothetical protein